MKSRFLLLMAVGVLNSSAYAQDTYRTYSNVRFGTKVIYPANLVAPRPESDNGDGRKFVSGDGQIELTVYAAYNVSNRSAGGEMARAVSDWKRDGARLVYSKSSASWFALSGYLGDDIFYEKTLLNRGVFHTLIWQYPKASKARLDASVTRSVQTFSSGTGMQTSGISSARPVTKRKPRAASNSRNSRPRTTPRSAPRAPSSGY